MTLLVRDEADIVDAQIAFHLDAGVDFVIATDHRSNDGTTEILERYERQGGLRLIRERDEEVRQSEWVTRMARLAANEHRADWVLNARRGRVLVAAGRLAEGRLRGHPRSLRRVRGAGGISSAAGRRPVPSPSAW